MFVFEMAPDAIYDLAIIGGGINGCGIARDAAGRGLKVLLCEQGDLAEGTSSASSKLIHGGLRYLEYYEFRLVREALAEREVLWRSAPHLIRPLRFVLPYRRSLRPRWLLRLGLFAYDHIGGRDLLPGTRSLDLRRDAAGAPLKPDFRHGFEYSDCWVDDARLVVLNARQAASLGARIVPRTRVVAAHRAGALWHLALETGSAAGAQSAAARVLINAAGPWVDEVTRRIAGTNAPGHVRLVRGSHIIVPRLYDHDRAYTLQQPDGRIVFVIPYEGDYSLIGTTDIDHVAGAGEARISEEEIDYLCAAASSYFRFSLRRAHVLGSYSGIRPLFNDGSADATAATRDYVLDLADTPQGAPLLTVYGGKITTYRRLAEHALEKLAPYFAGLRDPWTSTAVLPGGAFDVHEVDARICGLIDAYPFLDRSWARRLVRAYGTVAEEILGSARRETDLGAAFGATLTEAEVRHLVDNEWAVTAEDILWRRSKLGLRLGGPDVQRLEEYLASARMPRAARAR